MFSKLVLLLVPGAVAGAYNEALSIEYASLSGAAYCWEETLDKWDCGSKCIPGVSDVKVCHGATTKSFVGHWNGKCLVAFRGTANVQSMVTDLEFVKGATVWDECDNCKVHGGFLDEWYSMKDCVKSSLASIDCGAGEAPLYVTGHSLGAALSGIAMMSLHHYGWAIAEGYNFGMPRTGDAAFAREFDQLFSDRFFRVTHHKDPVPQVPPHHLVVDWYFTHVSPEIFYDGAVAAGHKECDATESPECADQYSNLLIDAFHIADHLDYMGIDTSVFGCPAYPSATAAVVV